jgi:hypothetical protein
VDLPDPHEVQPDRIGQDQVLVGEATQGRVSRSWRMRSRLWRRLT